MEFDSLRTLPHDRDAERGVLGSLFISPEKLLIAQEYLVASDFYYPAHQIIFKAMEDLVEKGQAIDGVTINTILDEQGNFEQVGGISYLAELVCMVPTSSHIESYAKTVAEKSAARQLIAKLSNVLGSAYEGEKPVKDIIATAEQDLMAILNNHDKQGFHNLYKTLLDWHEELSNRASQDKSVTGLATGFHDFDLLTTGLQEDNLIILAARPAMGKTAFALNIAEHVLVSEKKPVAIFSLEMGVKSLLERLVALGGLIPSYHLRTGNLSQDEWERVFFMESRLADSPLYIDDTAGLRISDIRSRATKVAKEAGGLGLIVIDYLQLITGRRSDNRQQEVAEISRQLKILAKELKVPVLALSQLSRGVEQRQDKRPLLSDLRESGSIEQDADIVVFLHRDGYYAKQDEEQPENNVTELILAKNRHGQLGTVNLYFHKEYTKFSNVTEEERND